jgi:hypothetical protein
MDKTNLILNSTIELVDVQEEGNGKGRPFVSRFIEPGIAHYKELGDILITKETLNKFINTMVGCPVIIEHEDVTDANADKLRVGVVSRVWFNEMDGYFYCEGILTDPEAIDLVKNQGYNVSCAYSFVSDNTKRTHNGKEIDMEFIDGEFLHLALVKDPRYEGANIVVNKNDDVNYISVGEGNNKHIIATEMIKDKEQRQKAEKKSKNLKDLKEDKEEFKDILKEKMNKKEEESKEDKKINKEEIIKKAETERAIFEHKQERENNTLNSLEKSKVINIGDMTMQVLNELKEFIKNVVSNEKEEEMKEVKNEDKRKLIDEVGGILKDKVDEELWRTVVGKLEKIAYEPSEDSKTDNEDDKEKEAKNKCKNEEDEEDVTKNEDKPEDDGEDEEEDKPEDKAENKKVKNSMRDMVMGGSSNVQEQKLYISRKERLEEGNKY